MSFNLNDQYVREFEEQRRSLEREVEEGRRLRREVEDLGKAMGLRDDELRGQSDTVRRLRRKLQAAEDTLAARTGALQAALAEVKVKEEEVQAARLANVAGRTLVAGAEELQATRESLATAKKELDAARAAAAAWEERHRAALAAATATNDELRITLGGLAGKDEEIEKLQALTTSELKKAKQSHAASLARKAEATRRLGLDLAEAREQVVGLQAELDELRLLEADLERLNHVPLRMRLVALGFDLVLLAYALDYLERWVPGWIRDSLSPASVVRFLLILGLRTFVSPGRILLGIYPRSIGPRFKPEGAAGIGVRTFCGLLHYGPMIVASSLVASDRPLLTALSVLWSRITNPAQPGPDAVVTAEQLHDSFRNSTALIILALSSAWWVVLLLTLLLSRWIHQETPYFWNTTLVEWMGRVGYERYRWPRATSESVL